MITYIKGDLLASDAQALVNTVNTVGVMGKGIALQFKEQYPDNYRIYRQACQQGQLTPGTLLITQCKLLGQEKLIINFPTKTTWRKPSQYPYIESGLSELRRKIQELGIRSIAIPPLGSHNGGLDWARVRTMITNALNGLDCDIRIYEPSDIIINRLKEERVKLTPARAILLDIFSDVVSSGELISTFAAEKIIYFLQRLGGKDIYNIEFSRGYYGPYSGGKISHLLYHLNGSYIKGMTGMQNKPFDEIWLLSDTPAIVTEYLSTTGNSRYKELAEHTKTFLQGYYSNYSLELLSTVDYIYNYENNGQTIKSQGPQQQIEYINQNISAWNSRKQRMFTGSRHIKNILEHIKTIT